MEPLRVLVVEDHPLFRKGVVALLEAVPDLAGARLAPTREGAGKGAAAEDGWGHLRGVRCGWCPDCG